MRFVLPASVMKKFVKYISAYDGDLISKDTAIEELQDALDSAEDEEIKVTEE